MTPRTPKLRSVKQGPKAGTDDIRLTGDRILVRVPDSSERRSKAGLLIPATATMPNKRCVWSEVILVGPETRNVQVGDEVLFIPQSGLEVDVHGDVFLLLRERDVQAVSSDRSDPQSGQYL